MPEDPKPATEAVAAIEKPTGEVAATMDEAASAVGDAAEAAADAGQDELATRLGALEVELRGHLQHPHEHGEPAVAASETVATPVAVETVEVAVPEQVVKPKRLHPYQRLRWL